MLDSNFDNSLKTESKKIEKNPILLIGIGIFAWIGIGSIAFLIERTIKDILLNIGISPNYIEIIAESVDFSIYIIGIIILVKIIRTNKFSEWNIFKFSVLLVIIGQLLQVIEPLINGKLRTEEYLNNSSQYYTFLKENPEYYSIGIVSAYLIWIIIALIIYLKKNNSG